MVFLVKNEMLYLIKQSERKVMLCIENKTEDSEKMRAGKIFFMGSHV